MLFKAAIVEVLIAAAAVANASPVAQAVDAKKTHTPLSQCPGRSKVYMALKSYSAPASFCSSFLPIVPVTHTVTATAAAPTTKTKKSKTKSSTSSAISTSSSSSTSSTSSSSSSPVVTSTAVVTYKPIVTVTSTSTTVMYPRCTVAARRRDVEGDESDDLNDSNDPPVAMNAAMAVPSPLNKFGKKRLSSACRCMHFPTSTVTTTVSASAKAKRADKTRTVDYTTTVTQTSTTTATAVATRGAQFIIQADTTNVTFANTYLSMPGADGNPSGFASPDNTPNVNKDVAAMFEITPTGSLVELVNGTLASIANQDSGVPCEFVYFNDQAAIDSFGATKLDCCVNGLDELSCTNANNATVFSFGPAAGLYFCTPQSEPTFGGLVPVGLKLAEMS